MEVLASRNLAEIQRREDVICATMLAYINIVNATRQDGIEVHDLQAVARFCRVLLETTFRYANNGTDRQIDIAIPDTKLDLAQILTRDDGESFQGAPSGSPYIVSTQYRESVIPGMHVQTVTAKVGSAETVTRRLVGQNHRR